MAGGENEKLLLFPKKDWLGKNAGGSRGGEKVSSGEIVEGNGGKRIIRCEEFAEAVGGGRDKIRYNTEPDRQCGACQECVT